MDCEPDLFCWLADDLDGDQCRIDDARGGVGGISKGYPSGEDRGGVGIFI
jgi:hypothetical protein